MTRTGEQPHTDTGNLPLEYEMKPKLTIFGHLAKIKLAADQSSAEGTTSSELTSDTEHTADSNGQLPPDPSANESPER